MTMTQAQAAANEGKVSRGDHRKHASLAAARLHLESLRARKAMGLP